MSKSNLDLFKQALTEGLSNRIDFAVNECYIDINYSKKHTIAMRTILHGKIREKRSITPKMKWVIAIVLSAALILTGCAIKFREYILGFIEEIKHSYSNLIYSEKNNTPNALEEIYEFTCVPEGYVLKDSIASPTMHKQSFINSEGTVLNCLQMSLHSIILLDSDDTDKEILKIGNYDVYHRIVSNMDYYLWNDGKYAFEVSAHTELTIEEITAIVNGVRLKQ